MLEKLVSTFERIATALERIAAVQVKPSDVVAVPTKQANPDQAAQPAPKQAEAKPEQKTETVTVTREQVGTALVALATSKGRDLAMKALATFSATKLDEVKAESYPALLAAINEAAK